jgi:hypothetical protein
LPKSDSEEKSLEYNFNHDERDFCHVLFMADPKPLEGPSLGQALGTHLLIESNEQITI